MNKQQIREYFEKYVKNFKPYRLIPEYSRLINSLIDHYLDHSYSEINSPFKTAFENQIIPKEFYNNLLLSIGFPETLISIFTEKDKKVLLSSFMDFNRYKGTIEQFKKVGESFEEPLSIYELFVDYRKINIFYYHLYLVNNSNKIELENQIIFDTLRLYDKIIIDDEEFEVKELVKDNNRYYAIVDKPYVGEKTELLNFSIDRWVFIPSLIYKYRDNKTIDELFPYIDIYNKTYHYFVNIEELELQRKQENIILPLKSNLIFIDYNRYKEANTLNNLFSTIFLKEYNDSRLTIFFKDGDYSITLGRLYKLWYYILAKFYNYDFIDTDIRNFVLFDKHDFMFDYDINDISNIKNEYNNIKTGHDFSQFYYKYISSKLLQDEHIENSISLEDIEFIIRNEVGKELIDYINERVNNSHSEIKQYEYNFILDEIYNSVITWVALSEDNNITDNYEYFLNNMTRISYSIEMSPSYNLINFLKPYHTEIISELSEYIKINGKENIINTEILFKLFIHMTQASFYNLSEYILQYMQKIDYEYLNINTSCLFELNHISNQFTNKINDYINIKLKYMSSNENNISVSTIKSVNDIELVIKSIIPLISNFSLNINAPIKNQIELLHSIEKLLTSILELNIDINTIYQNYNLFSILKDFISLTSEYCNTIIYKFNQEYNLDIEKLLTVIQYVDNSLNISTTLSNMSIDSDKFGYENVNIGSRFQLIPDNLKIHDNLDINDEFDLIHMNKTFVNLIHFYQFLDHTMSYFMTVNMLVELFIDYNVKIKSIFKNTDNLEFDYYSKLRESYYNDVNVKNKLVPVFSNNINDFNNIDFNLLFDLKLVDVDSTSYIYNLCHNNIIMNDFDPSAYINDLSDFNILIQDFDESGYVNILPDLNMNFNKLENLTVSHTFNLI